MVELDERLHDARAELARLRRYRGTATPAAPVTGSSSDPGSGATRSRAEVPAGSEPSPRWRRHLPVNVSGPERVVRGVVGVALAIALVLVSGQVGGTWGTALYVLAWAAVIDLVVSGLIGHCPLHRWVRLPWDPRP